jgi:hypothetical protein
MRPRDPRLGRNQRGVCACACFAAGLILVWFSAAEQARAESWVLHLPMVIGSIAPADPVRDGWGTPLAQAPLPAMWSPRDRWAAGEPAPTAELWEPVAPLSWHLDGPPRMAGPVSPPPPGSAEFPAAPGGDVVWLEELRPGNASSQAPLWELHGLREEVVFSQWADVDPLLEPTDEWTWQVMPIGLLYRSYLAGAKEPRFSSYLNRDTELGQIWDASLGARIGILRYGTEDVIRPEGWQIDLEGGCQARLDPIADSTPLLSVDFRVGVPVTWAQGPWQFKTGYYHISAHLGDEFLILFPDARRLNYTRDSIMLGLGYFWTESIRLYGEVAYAVGANDGAEPWEMQFGIDWVPAHDTGVRGAPFAALNAHLREDVDFNGNLVVQAGWAWRQHARGSLFRTGLQYYRGKSDQYEYFDYSERRFGWGMWADF